MNPPILVLRSRRYHFAWTELAAPVNDALRCFALCKSANDNSWMGGRPA